MSYTSFKLTTYISSQKFPGNFIIEHYQVNGMFVQHITEELQNIYRQLYALICLIKTEVLYK